MSLNTPDSADESITETIRKALLELNAIIPTTPDEVEIVERVGHNQLSDEELSIAFAKLCERLREQGNNEVQAKGFLTFAQPEDSSGSLSMAARKGNKLAADVLAKIKCDVARALGNENAR